MAPQQPSPPVVTPMSTIFLPDGIQDHFDSFSSSALETIKEDQYAGFQLDNQPSTGMAAEYQMDQSSSYDNSYEQYQDADGQFRGARMQQGVGQYESIRPPLYVGPSSYNINRVVDHQLDQNSVDINGDLVSQDPCAEQHVDPAYDQAYDPSFDQSYEQQFDQTGLKQQPSQQMIGGQHQLDMLVQQFQQQSIQSHPSYPQVHQMQIQQTSAQTMQRQLPQTVPQLQQQLPMHVYQQQQIPAAGQAVVLIGGQRNVSTLVENFPN